jgi:hypothetical protein
MSPKDLFGKYASYVFIIYTILKIVFEYDSRNPEVSENSEPVQGTDVVQENVVGSSTSRNVTGNARSRTQK